MAITAAMVKELREMTNVGMLDCKKALQETNGDMEKAVEYLREKGLAASQKKAGRVAAEGVVTIKLSDDSKKGVVLEVNSETDFVAKKSRVFGICGSGGCSGAGKQCSRCSSTFDRTVEGRAFFDCGRRIEPKSSRHW